MDASHIVDNLLETDIDDPRQIIRKLLEDGQRFFVYDPRKNDFSSMQNDPTGGAWAYRPMQVLDRETVINRKYKVMADNLHYLDAMALARQLNADPTAVGVENPDDFDPKEFLGSVLGKDNPEVSFRPKMERPAPWPGYDSFK